MASRWEQFAADGDRYNLQYRTANDGSVRPEHAALHGVTLPPSDPFWQSYFPPNGWNCRCTAVQVLKDKYPETPHDEAEKRAANALSRDHRGMFRFNPGIQRKTFPDYNPYTISRCRDCDLANGKLSLAKVPENEICAACQLVRQCELQRGCKEDDVFGNRLLISNSAHSDELKDNIRAARSLLGSFSDMTMKIREHILVENQPNPEYEINGLIADRKGIESEKGVANAFKKAKKQGCEAVVIDLDMNMRQQPLRDIKLAKEIYFRHMDFEDGLIKECYIVYHDKAVRIDSSLFVPNERNISKGLISQMIKKIAE